MKNANLIHLIAGATLVLGTGLAGAAPFDKEMELQGISFHVTSPNQAEGNTLRIVPTGLLIDNSPIEMDIPGMVTGAEVADINADRSPEIYIYVLEPGAQHRLSLVAFSANHRKSLSGIHLPPLSATRGADQGYCGNDAMAAVAGVFLRRFPLCGTDQQPTGKTRQLRYRLKPGEASWQLKLDGKMDY